MLATRLKDQGVWLSVNGEKLTVETAAPLTDEQRHFIRSHKVRLMAELKRCCMWSYRLDPESPGRTRMGLLTGDIEEAHRQLRKIYGRVVDDLKPLSEL